MVNPKGTVPDHWTWRDGHAAVTGWHVPKKRGKQQDEGPVFVERVSRGVVATSSPKRPKSQQGQLL